MKVLLGIALFCATLWQTDAADPLHCRRCIGAATLDDCTFSVPCPDGEICYMDEIITEQLTIEYNGGCRPRDVCTKGRPMGKRELVACSKCCDIKNDHGSECNSKMCGIKSSNTSKCYHCESETGAGGSGVSDPDKCTNLVSCQSHQICGAETIMLGDKPTHEFKCIQKDLCTLLTQESMKRHDECVNGGNTAACGNVKRETSGTKVCTACCGDSQCNSESCNDIIKTLYVLWKGGVLDYNTLKTNGTTLPATTTAAASTVAGAGVTVSG